MDSNQRRHDEQVSAGTVPAMVKDAMEKHGYDVASIAAPSKNARFVGDDGSTHAIKGKATVQIAEATGYRTMEVRYEIGPTYNDGAYSFVEMVITLWVPL